MSKVHADKFDGYSYEAALMGEAAEKYAPLCGARPNDPRITTVDSRVTCKRCLTMLRVDKELGYP